MIDVDAWDIADIAATALILAIRTWETPGHRPATECDNEPRRKTKQIFSNAEAGEINEA